MSLLVVDALTAGHGSETFLNRIFEADPCRLCEPRLQLA